MERHQRRDRRAGPQPNAPSRLALDRANGDLYTADTGAGGWIYALDAHRDRLTGIARAADPGRRGTAARIVRVRA
jgi:hypothetical protein